MRTTMMSLSTLLLLLLLFIAILCGHSGVVEERLFKEATSLRESLEAQAWDLLGEYEVLVEKFGHEKDAEGVLRKAIAVCPWIPEPYSVLATHLMNYGSQRQVREILVLYRQAMRMQHALPTPQQEGTASDLMRSLHKRPSVTAHFAGQTFPARLRHDRDQLALLGERGRLPQSVIGRYLKGYDHILAQIPQLRLNYQMEIPEKLWAQTIGNVYQRALYVPEIAPLKGPALNPDLDFAGLEDQYLSGDPHFVYFDNLLTEEALLKLREYYEEATIFWDAKPGYVGTYLADGGFGNSVIAQLLEELTDAFPRLLCSHRLKQAWAYKYDSDIAEPIATHADIAAVNFNFWISPDEGNLDKESGGLVVYRAIPPEGTPPIVFNRLPLHQNVTNMLEATGYANFTVPYRTNRAVVFQSNLFHESGKMHWAPGFTKRRINLTLLFGKMYGTCDAQCATDADAR
jgi:hypothetical protein